MTSDNERQPKEPSDDAKALYDIIEILSALAPRAQIRVVRALAVFFNVDDPEQPGRWTSE